MPLKTVRDVIVENKRVLVRVDFNVPIGNGEAIDDDTRIRAALDTIGYLLAQGAGIILVSHRGRPQGEPDCRYSLRPCAQRLEQLLGRPVLMADDVVGPSAQSLAAGLQSGEVLMLENVRFEPGEKTNDPVFARKLAELADLYVNDAFGSAHRNHASTVGIADYLPAVAGLLLDTEVKIMGQALTAPARPFAAIVGGAKVSDKIGVLGNLLSKVDSLVIGGGMANTFLLAMGAALGASLVEVDQLGLAQDLLREAAAGGVAVHLPVDLIAAEAPEATVSCRTVPAMSVPGDMMALDIGPETARRFTDIIRGARTIIWNGPMGVFELGPFAGGTMAVARAVAENSGLTIVGGGDSVAAVRKAGVADRITHLSTGGGASLELLAGKTLPGLAVLEPRRASLQ